jgi:hypothetical protein
VRPLRRRAPSGEVGLALLFAAIGLAWIAGALGLPLWEGFAPQSGFLPLLYGLLLSGLAVAILVNLIATDARPAELQPIGKPVLVLVALAAVVLGVEAAGFAIATFVFLSFLFAVVERRPVGLSLVVAAATTAVLLGVFKTWLGVPLPAGPWGL